MCEERYICYVLPNSNFGIEMPITPRRRLKLRYMHEHPKVSRDLNLGLISKSTYLRLYHLAFSNKVVHSSSVVKLMRVSNWEPVWKFGNA